MNLIVDNRFTVKLIRRGQAYGRDNCLINHGTPLVEFWDNKHDQFVSRYDYMTMLQHDGGLDLQGDVPAWKVSAEGIDKVKWFLLGEIEKAIA